MTSPWQLYAPGKRRNNKTWVGRRKEADGREREVRTPHTNKREAKAFLDALDRGQVAPPEPKPRRAAATPPWIPPAQQIPGFGEAVRSYAMKRALDLDYPRAHPSAERDEIRRLVRLEKEFGDRPVTDISDNDLIALAQRDLPHAKASTRNREIISPARSVVRFAAKNKTWQAPMFESFDERTPDRPAMSAADEERWLTLAAAKGPRHYLLVLWMARHGSRITETLHVRWENLDLDGVEEGVPVVHMRTKGDEPWTFQIHDEVLAELCKVPEGERTGRLFPDWGYRGSVRNWLNKIEKQHQLPHLSPHQLRRTVARNLDGAGVGIDDIANTLGHKSLRSTMIYVRSKNVKRAGAAINRVLGRKSA